MSRERRSVNNRNTYEVVSSQIRRNVWLIALVVVLMAASTGLSLLIPLLLRYLVDVAIPSKDIELLIILLLAITVIPVGSAGLSALTNYYRASIGETVSQVLRRRLFNNLIHSRLDKMQKDNVGDVVYTMTRDCGRVGEVFVSQQIVPLLHNLLIVVATITVMFALHWRLSLVSLLAFPLSLLLTRAVAKRSGKLDSDFTDLLASGEAYLNQVLGPGLKTVKAFRGQSREESWWSEWIRQHWKLKARMIVLHDLVRLGIAAMIHNSVRGLIFGYGAFEVISESATIGDLVAFSAYVPGLYQGMQSLMGVHIESQRLKVSADRINTLLRRELEEATHGQASLARSTEGARIEFRNVSFRYDQSKFALDAVSFAAKPNEFVGIVGPTGGGKTTLLDILMGFYPPDGGTIYIDGVDYHDLSVDSIRKHIAVVPQDIFLWNDTVLANVTYPELRPAIKDAERATRDAQLEELISKLPSGYAHVLDERGADLSSGERQRMAIARALYKESRLVVLDEPTAELDALTEAALLDVIRAIRRRSTLIVVAHRLKTIIDADNILVIERGRLVESGTPERLSRAGGLFAKMYDAQSLSGEKA